MNNSLEHHKQKMKSLSLEIERATGYRKKDLLRQYRKMKKELNEYLYWQNKRAFK